MSDSTQQIAIGFRIRGVGSTNTEYAETFTFRRESADLITWGSEVTPAIQEIPGTVPREIDPISGDVSVGVPSPVTLSYTDATAQLFDPPRGAGTTASLTDDLLAADTEAPIDQSGLDGQVIWIDHEAIELGAYDSQSGTYAIETRDAWGLTTTAAEAHQAGSQIFTAVPRWTGLEVEIVVEDGVEQSGWLAGAGIIQDVTAQNATVDIDVRDRMGPPLTASVGREQTDMTQLPGVTAQWVSAGGGPAGLTMDLPDDFESQVHKGFEADDDDLWVAVDGESIYLNPHEQSPSAPLGDGQDPDIDFGDGEHYKDVTDAAIYEVIPFGDFLFPAQRGAHPLLEPTRPLFAAQSLYESGYVDGPWQPAWGLDVTLASEVLTTGLIMDRLYLGGDGEPVDPWSTFLEPLRFFGFLTRMGVTSTSGGQREIGYELIRWGLPTIADTQDVAATVSHVSHEIEYAGRLDASYSEIEAQLGGQMGDEPRPITATPVGLPERPLWMEENATTVEIPWLSASDWTAVEPHLVAALYRHQQTWNRVTIDVPRYTEDGSARTIRNGDWIEIDDLNVRGDYIVVDGQRIEVAPDAESVYGWVQSVELNLKTQVWTIGALIPGGDIIRHRAPAPVIVSVSPDTPVAGRHAIRVDEPDAAFLVGESVRYARHDLSAMSGEPTDGTVYDVVNDVVTVEGSAPSSAVEGQVLRLRPEPDQGYGASVQDDRESIYFDLSEPDIYGV